jgi:hypothetical protein
VMGGSFGEFALPSVIPLTRVASNELTFTFSRSCFLALIWSSVPCNSFYC